MVFYLDEGKCDVPRMWWCPVGWSMSLNEKAGWVWQATWCMCCEQPVLLPLRTALRFLLTQTTTITLAHNVNLFKNSTCIVTDLTVLGLYIVTIALWKLDIQDIWICPLKPQIRSQISSRFKRYFYIWKSVKVVHSLVSPSSPQLINTASSSMYIVPSGPLYQS